MTAPAQPPVPNTAASTPANATANSTKTPATIVASVRTPDPVPIAAATGPLRVADPRDQPAGAAALEIQHKSEGRATDIAQCRGRAGGEIGLCFDRWAAHSRASCLFGRRDARRMASQLT